MYTNNIKLYREVKIMREGIHPNYYQATVTCNCGNTFVTGSLKRTSMLRSVPNAIRSTPRTAKATQARGRIDKFNKKYGLNK